MIDKRFREAYNDVGKLLRSGKCDVVDMFLLKVDVGDTIRNSEGVLIGYLTATLPYSGELFSRSEFYERVRSEFERRGVDVIPLRGLEGSKIESKNIELQAPDGGN